MSCIHAFVAVVRVGSPSCSPAISQLSCATNSQALLHERYTTAQGRHHQVARCAIELPQGLKHTRSVAQSREEKREHKPRSTRQLPTDYNAASQGAASVALPRIGVGELHCGVCALIGLWSRVGALKEMKLIKASARGARELCIRGLCWSTQDTNNEHMAGSFTRIPTSSLTVKPVISPVY